jgi:hypothetical protein
MNKLNNLLEEGDKPILMILGLINVQEIIFAVSAAF